MKHLFRTSFALGMLGILIAPYALIAIDTTTSARIIENFKEDQKEILFETLPVSES